MARVNARTRGHSHILLNSEKKTQRKDFFRGFLLVSEGRRGAVSLLQKISHVNDNILKIMSDKSETRNIDLCLEGTPHSIEFSQHEKLFLFFTMRDMHMRPRFESRCPRQCVCATPSVYPPPPLSSLLLC